MLLGTSLTGTLCSSEKSLIIGGKLIFIISLQSCLLGSPEADGTGLNAVCSMLPPILEYCYSHLNNSLKLFKCLSERQAFAQGRTEHCLDVTCSSDRGRVSAKCSHRTVNILGVAAYAFWFLLSFLLTTQVSR